VSRHSRRPHQVRSYLEAELYERVLREAAYGRRGSVGRPPLREWSVRGVIGRESPLWISYPFVRSDPSVRSAEAPCPKSP
jgi:hypothetical protein